MCNVEAMTVKKLKCLLHSLSSDHAKESQEKSKKVKTMKYNNSKKIGHLEDLMISNDKRLKLIQSREKNENRG